MRMIIHCKYVLLFCDGGISFSSKLERLIISGASSTHMLPSAAVGRPYNRPQAWSRILLYLEAQQSNTRELSPN